MKFAKLLAHKNSDLYGAKPVTITFLGDSVTQGCFETFRIGENRLDTIYEYDEVYHTKLKRKLNEFFPVAPINLINAGLSGDNVRNAFTRLERDVLTYSPDLVVVCFGLNDVHNGIEELHLYELGLQNIFRRLKEEQIEVIFMTPNMMNTNVSPHITDEFMKELAINFAKIQNEGVMDAYMESARRVCLQEGITICDCYKKWKQLEELGVNVTELLSNQLNHPTRRMHDFFANQLLQTIMFEA